MTTSVTADDRVLDLRGRPDGEPHGKVGRVVVLDHATSLVDHWDTYLALAADREVTGVICIAVGEPSAQDADGGAHSPVVLRVPAVLTQSGGAVLWVGDEQGVRWGSRVNQPVPIRRGADEPSGLDRLVMALSVEEVFDAVRAQVQGMAERVASPGLELFSAAVSGQLGSARDAAVERLVRVRSDQAPTDVLRDTIRDLAQGPRPDVGGDLDGKGKVGRPRRDATAFTGHAADLAREARSLALLTGNKKGARPGPDLGRYVRLSGRSTAEYRREAATLLDRIDGQLRRGDTTVPQVVEMGVREPISMPAEQVVERLSTAIARHLKADPSVPTLAVHLRRAAVALEPAGCPHGAEAVRGTGERSLERSLPTATQWPVSPLLLPLVLLTCFVATLVPTPPWLGWIFGVLAVLAWFVPAWLLLGRWPQDEGEIELGEAVVPATLSFGLTGIAGLALGALAARYLADIALLDFLPDMPTRWRVYLVLGAFLVAAVAVWSSWSIAAARLRRRLGTRGLTEVHSRVSRLVDDVVGPEWVQSARRRQLAAALHETADGLREIELRLRQEIEDRPENKVRPLFTRPASPYTPAALPTTVRSAIGTEVSGVVLDDLLRIVRVTLERAWFMTLHGRRAHPFEYRDRLDGLLAEYDEHVYRFGLMMPPRPVDEREQVPDPDNDKDKDKDKRVMLLERVWGNAPQGRAVLRTRAFDDMTQLCSPRQLGDLYTSRDPVMVGFAPVQVRQVLTGSDGWDATTFDSFVWTDRAELAGVVRLLELQAGARETDAVGGGR